jgi:hypothetical protein
MAEEFINKTILLKNTPEILAVLNSLYNPRGKILINSTGLVVFGLTVTRCRHLGKLVAECFDLVFTAKLSTFQHYLSDGKI